MSPRNRIDRLILLIFICFNSLIARPQSAADTAGKVIDFISDTQQPMGIEKLKLKSNHNEQATAMIFSDILKTRPMTVYILGDVVAVGSSNNKWAHVDRFIDSCRKEGIPVHGLLGNHDVMWSRKKGEKRFQKRFPDNVDTGYVSIIDSVAIILLNSNFKKLKPEEISSELQWYKRTLGKLDENDAIRVIIVTCHHAPYSNSLIVGSSKKVQEYFVPPFIETKKAALFITGHSHAFEHFLFFQKHFLVIGGGGGLHQPLDSSVNRIPDLAIHFKPMFHYLSIQRTNGELLITSHFLKPDFSGFAMGYSFKIPNPK